MTDVFPGPEIYQIIDLNRRFEGPDVFVASKTKLSHFEIMLGADNDISGTLGFEGRETVVLKSGLIKPIKYPVAKS